PRPRRRELDAFDVLERLEEELAVLRAARREREATVPHYGRRDAIPGRGREHPVPVELGVEMRVRVDEAGTHNHSRGVDLTHRCLVDDPDVHDAAAPDTHVARECGGAGAIDNRAVAYLQIQHFAAPHARRMTAAGSWKKLLPAQISVARASGA